MTISLWRALWLALGAAIVSAAISTAHSQKAERGTQHWTVAMPSGPLSDYGTVHVFDMTGVCLYVFDGPGEAGGITVISKAQLPTGAGCQ